MRHPEQYIGPIDVVRGLVDIAKSQEMKDSLKLAGRGLYAAFRWGLAAALHPVTTFRAGMQIGDQETISRNADRALSLPGLPVWRDTYRRLRV